ncbi:MAG: DUF4388 domain-containing protein [Acidimicrobiia bacterium]|nr:DUF4388 domain-containing protein [Acidimicrobiia bacterium]
MSDLTGNLASFDLRQVLGFLAETTATGELAVSADHVYGRILFQNGSVGYATTATGDDIVQQLDALLERHRTGGFDALPLNQGPLTLEDVLRDQLTEVLHSLTALESGSFAFASSLAQSGQDVIDVFAVEELLRDVDVRIEEWRRIREVVPANDTVYELVRTVPEHRSEVTLSAPLWALVAALGAGASVTELADSLDVYEFRAALKVADLVKDGLLEPAGAWVDAEPTADTGWQQSDAGLPDEWPPVDGNAGDWNSADEPTDQWQADLEALAEPDVPRIEPTTERVTFSKDDLSREERDEIIRNIGRGIFPS